MQARQRLAEYFLVSRVARKPPTRGPSVHDENGGAGDLDPSYLTAKERHERRAARRRADTSGSTSNLVSPSTPVTSDNEHFEQVHRRDAGANNTGTDAVKVPHKRSRSRRDPANPELFAEMRLEGDDDPIVDICVIFPNQREKIPTGFRCLVRTPLGYRGDCNSGVVGSEGVFICVKHSKSHKPTTTKSPKLLPIVDVKIVFLDKESVPEGYELIDRSRSGALPANLNYGYLGQTIFLAIKRMPAEPSADERYHSLRPLVDICMINASKQENPPRGYDVILKSTSEGNWTGNKMYLCLRRARPVGMLDRSFGATLAERVPRHDRPGLPISDEMALLTAPGGLRCLRREETNVPIPKFFSFVMTKEDGSQIHASCLTFYEVLDDSTLDVLERSYDAYLQIMNNSPSDPMVHRQLRASAAANRCELVRTDSQGRHRGYTTVRFYEDSDLQGSTRSIALDEYSQKAAAAGAATTTSAATAAATTKKHPLRPFKTGEGAAQKIYCPTVLCILSHFPFYREFKQFLMLLYQVSISSTVIPIERYVAQLMYELPVPRPGTSGFVLQFGAAHRGIHFSMPPEGGLPIASVNYETVFRCLGPKEFVQLFALILLEKKIILHSRYVSVLNQVAEAMRSLMFPLNWQNIYIPVCPNNLAHFLAAPRPFVIGLQTDAFAQVQLSAPEAGEEGWWEIALDEGKIHYLDVLERATTVQVASLLQTPPGGDAINPIRVVRSNVPAPTLPTPVLNGMLKRLRASVLSRAPSLEDEIGKGATRVLGQQNPDNAYSLTPLEARGEEALRSLQFAVRDAAIHAMIELIGTYRDFLLPPRLASRGLSRAEVLPTNLSDIFNLDGFLRSLPKATRPFTEQLTKTMHFTKFVDERTFSTDLSYRFLFFDAIIAHAQRGADPLSSFRRPSGPVIARTTSSTNDAGLAKSSAGMSAFASFPGNSANRSGTNSPASPSSARGARDTRQSADGDLLILRVLEETTGRPASAFDEDAKVMDGGGGEEEFSALCEEQSRNFKLNYHNWNQENPWKPLYVYDHFPSQFEDVLLMAHLSLKSSRGSGGSERRRGSQRSSLARAAARNAARTAKVNSAANPDPTRSRAFSSPQGPTGTFELVRSTVLDGVSLGSRRGLDENIWDAETSHPTDRQHSADGSFMHDAQKRSNSSSDADPGKNGPGTRAPADDDDEGSFGSDADSESSNERAQSLGDEDEDDDDIDDIDGPGDPILRAASETNASRDARVLATQPTLRSDRMRRQSDESASDRTVRAGCRLSEELNRSNLEQQFAFSEPTTGMPRARACYVETLGAIMALAPVLLSSRYARPRFAMSLILGSLTALGRRHGHVLDEAATRAVLAGCALSGPVFAHDANNAFHSLVEHGCRPNAVTYGYFTMALALRGKQQSRTRRSSTIWKRLVSFLWAYLAILRPNPSSLTAKTLRGQDSRLSNSQSEADAASNQPPAVNFIALWTGTRCPNCKARLLDEHIMQGWEVDVDQLVQSCAYCNFVIVPRIEYRVLKVTATEIIQKHHGQCEYMSPIVLRRQAEYMVDALAERRTLGLSRSELRRTNPALYYNILWYAKRVNAPVLFSDEQYDATMWKVLSSQVRTVVSCTWQRFPVRDARLVRRLIAAAGGSWVLPADFQSSRRNDPFAPPNADSDVVQGRGVARRGSMLFERGVLSTHMSASTIADAGGPNTGGAGNPRRLQTFAASSVADQVDPNVYMVRHLAAAEPITGNSLWGNRAIAEKLRDPEIQATPPAETFYVTSESTSFGVVRKMLVYLDNWELLRAVRLFLSARMASRGEREGDGYVDKDGVVCRVGWELFVNSVYIELAALSRMGQRQRVNRAAADAELELERALTKVLRNLEHVDPTLASFVDKRDFPPNMRALAFRNFFSPLYP